MIKTYIPRERYIEKIKPFIDKDIIKVFTGQRRVGKSYMLFHVMDLLLEKGIKEKNIIYINKELHEFEDIKTHKDLIEYINKIKLKNQKNYIFIDEVQEIDKFEKALESLLAEGGFDIYCTGSNANMLSGELATYLSGRYIEIKIFGLSYLEFLKFHRLEKNKDSFFKFIKYGGLPYLINLSLEDDVIYEYLINIYNAILFKDVVKRHGVRNIAFLEKLIEYVADNTGSIVSAKKISDFLKSQKINISPNVIIEYLNYLTNAFFLFKASRSEIGGKKIFKIDEKYFFEDLGLRHSVIGYKQTDISKILENIVFLHLKILGYKITVGKLYDKEIDFVCEKLGEKIYIQVVYLINNEKTIEREFGNLLKIKDNYRKIVVSMDEVIGNKYKGIEQINILDFLCMEV
jgi:uncharacterized protein